MKSRLNAILLIGLLVLAASPSTKIVSSAYSGSTGFMGVYVQNCCNPFTDVKAYFYNNNLPNGGWATGDLISAVLTASIDGYVVQDSITHSVNWAGQGTSCFGEDQWTYSNQHVWSNNAAGPCGISTGWHTLEMTLYYVWTGSTYYTYVVFVLDGTWHDQRQVATGSKFLFDNGVVPNFGLESHGDFNSGDFSSTDLHGYLYLDGTVQSTHLYGGAYAADHANCYVSQNSNPGWYVGDGKDLPGNIGVTGHYWNSN